MGQQSHPVARNWCSYLVKNILNTMTFWNISKLNLNRISVSSEVENFQQVNQIHSLISFIALIFFSHFQLSVTTILGPFTLLSKQTEA